MRLTLPSTGSIMATSLFASLELTVEQIPCSLIGSAVRSIALEVPILIPPPIGVGNVATVTSTWSVVILRIVPQNVLVVARFVGVPKIASRTLWWWLVRTRSLLSVAASKTNELPIPSSEVNEESVSTRLTTMTEASGAIQSWSGTQTSVSSSSTLGIASSESVIGVVLVPSLVGTTELSSSSLEFATIRSCVT